MNIKPAQQVLNFEVSPLDNSKSTPLQSFRTDKSRVSYGGGFHISKKPESIQSPSFPQSLHPSEIAHRLSSPNGYSSIDVVQNEIQRLKNQSQELEKLRNSKPSDRILHMDTYNYQRIPEEKTFYHENITLNELERLKEKNAAKIIEIEAEMARSKQENVSFGQKKAEYVPVFTKPQKKTKTIEEYQKKYQEKFEKYRENKEKQKNYNKIKGKQMSPTENLNEDYSEALDTQILLK